MYLPSIIITSIINFTGFLHKYKAVSNQQDLPAVFLAVIRFQVTYPNSQTHYYENHQDDCINSMEKFYELRNEKDLIETTDHETSRLTIISLLDYIKEIIKPTAMTVYQSYFNLTDCNLPISLQETLDVDHNTCNCCNTPWKNDLDTNFSIKMLLIQNITDSFKDIFISISTIFPSFQSWKPNMMTISRLGCAIQSMTFITLVF